MEKIDRRPKLIVPMNVTNNVAYGSNNNDNVNIMEDSVNKERSKTTRAGEIIVLKNFTEERLISLTIMGILSTFLLLIIISFIYIYICKKYFRQYLSTWPFQISDNTHVVGKITREAV